MIITRSPLRISLGGGGTDLPFYYRERQAMREKGLTKIGDGAIDYRKVAFAFSAGGKAQLMTFYCNEGRWDTSNAQFENQPNPALWQKATHPGNVSHRLWVRLIF